MTLHRIKNSVVATLWIAIFYFANTAGGRAETALSDSQDADLSAIETFLAELTTMQARFIQVGSDGTYADGMFWLSRPGYARFEYAPPVDLLLVADGYRLKFYDGEVDQVVDMALDSGPFRFLLGESVDIRKDMIIQGVERRENIIRIGLQDREDPREGTVTLIFEDGPLRLRQWEILDPQGHITAVTLYGERYGTELDQTLFRFTENDRLSPDFRRGRYE